MTPTKLTPVRLTEAERKRAQEIADDAGLEEAYANGLRVALADASRLRGLGGHPRAASVPYKAGKEALVVPMLTALARQGATEREVIEALALENAQLRTRAPSPPPMGPAMGAPAGSFDYEHAFVQHGCRVCDAEWRVRSDDEIDSPPSDDDAAWAEVAKKHRPGCAFVARRGVMKGAERR